jgi:hypothetical protein
MTHAVKFLTCIRDVRVFDIRRDTDYSDLGFRHFLSSVRQTQAHCQISSLLATIKLFVSMYPQLLTTPLINSNKQIN